MLACQPDIPTDLEEQATPPVDVRRRTTLASPVVFASPHSGRFYPPSLKAASRLSAHDLRLSEDAWVDALIGPAEEAGVALVLANYARAWADLNRGPRELDPFMFDTPPDGAPAARSARVAAGLGCIPRIVGHGREIYAGRLASAEAERRLRTAWRPYHQALERLTGEARTTFGEVVLVDWHSMPSSAGAAERARRGRGPDVVLGDRHGSSCSRRLTAHVEAAFQAMGYRVARNAPYAGGWTTEQYGRPEEGAHALQIELNRALYMDEGTLERTGGFPRLRRDVVRVAGALVELSSRP